MTFVRSEADWIKVRRGDIIVAPVIDPGMAPLFGVAAGLVVEMGGTLSHGAIIAREYGLPTITNVRRVMTQLSQGEIVTVDARQGIVRREAAASGPNSQLTRTCCARWTSALVSSAARLFVNNPKDNFLMQTSSVGPNGSECFPALDVFRDIT